jgi:hypothetical protein
MTGNGSSAIHSVLKDDKTMNFDRERCRRRWQGIHNSNPYMYSVCKEVSGL